MFKDRAKLMIVLCHASPLLGVGIILPAIVYIKKKETALDVAEHAKKALNFQITYLIYGLLSLPLFLVFLIGFFTLLAVLCAVTIFAIIAVIKATEGTIYEYPFTIGFIK